MIQIFDCEQGTEPWFRCRMGIPTSSEFKTIIGVKKDAKDKVTRHTYMLKLAGEVLTDTPMESYQNANMERGKIMEDEARDFYAFTHDVELHRVGFIRNGQKGCSPDSLIGTNGGLEIKTAFAHIQIERLLKNEFPPEHRAQVQGNLWISEREYWDFVSHWPKLPQLVKRVYRDESYIHMLATAVDEFNYELAEMVSRIRRYGGVSAIAAGAIPPDLLMAG